MGYVLEFTLPGLPPMTNRSRGKHWSWAHAQADAWKRDVWLMVLKHGRPPQPLSKAYLRLTRYSSGPPDGDGLISSFKHIIDGLVEARVLENDRLGNIGIPFYHWHPAKRTEGHVSIRVEER